MIHYPIEFASHTQAKSGIGGTWTSQSEANTSHCCVPKEFLGPGGALSPEDLFNHALTNCFVATFKVYAENSKLNFDSLTAKSTLTVEPGSDGKPVMKKIEIHVKIFNPSNKDKALMLAKKASEGGFILNSVKTERHFTFEMLFSDNTKEL